MNPTAQDPSSTFPSRDRTKTQQDERRGATQQSKLVARESQTAHHLEDPKSPTLGEDKDAASTAKTSIPRGRRPNRPARSGNITWARATSVPTSRSQQTAPTRDRSLNPTCGRADKVSSNSTPTANQVRPNATTHPQEPLRTTHSTISRNSASGNATLTNNIVHNVSERNSSRRAIQDLKITNPRWDRREIEDRHIVCENHLQKVCRHPSYESWKNDDETRLLWIYSHNRQTIDYETMDFETGDQKRIIAAAITKELEQSPVVRANALSYVFCRDSKNPELKLNDTAAILRVLMWLLSDTQEKLRVYLGETYNREGMSMYKDQHAKHALSVILLRWLEDTHVDRVYLVIGAIDECYIEGKNDILHILNLITRCCKELAKVKWLITSDYDDIYINFIKARLDTDDRSFKTIHLNERRKPGSKWGTRAERRQRHKKKALGKGTKGTNQEIESGGEEDGQLREGYLDKGKGGASDTITEEYVAAFSKEVAGENRYEKPKVSGGKKGANAGRGQELNIPDERTPLLTQRTPSSPLNSGESTPIPQQGSVSEPGSSNVQDGSAKRGCLCVVQ